MNTSAQDAEREVEANRARLDETVDAPKEKLTPGQMFDEMSRSFAGSSGGEMFANFGSQIRDNPLPLALIGAGVALLAMKSPTAGAVSSQGMTAGNGQGVVDGVADGLSGKEKLQDLVGRVGDPMSLMMRQIMNLFDEYQSREHAKHTPRTMKENARQGFWNGARPPVGYKIVGAEQRGTKIKTKLEIEPVQAEKIRLIYRLALTGDEHNGPMGIKAIATYMNTRGLTTRDGGRWGSSAVHYILTAPTYIGEHHFNNRVAKTGEFKGEEEHVVIAVPPIVSREEFDAVQRSMNLRRPTTAHSQVYCGPTLLGGIIFCGQCGGAMTLRTGRGNGGQYRYYTCCTRAHRRDGMQGRHDPRGCGRYGGHPSLENRLLEPKRLAAMMDNIIDRRDAFVQRRAKHIADLRKRATETDAKLQRLYEAVENGLADPGERSLKSRIVELRQLRDGLEGEATRTAAAVERMGASLTPELLKQFAKATRQMLRDENGGYRRDLLKAVAQRVDVSPDRGLRVSGCKVELLRAITANNGVESAALDVRTHEPVWRALLDSNQRPLA
ncbi:hypothetical protein BH10PSE3_BH10PSE3_01450 [soil metagenome]